MRDFWSRLHRPDPLSFSLRPMIQTGGARVWPLTYALVQVDARFDAPSGTFMVTREPQETTAILDEAEIDRPGVLGVRRGYRAIELAVSGPAVGFLAAVTTALAKAGIDLLAVSAFSKDVVLVPEARLESAEAVLKQLGFQMH